MLAQGHTVMKNFHETVTSLILFYGFPHFRQGYENNGNLNLSLLIKW